MDMCPLYGTRTKARQDVKQTTEVLCRIRSQPLYPACYPTRQRSLNISESIIFLSYIYIPNQVAIRPSNRHVVRIAVPSSSARSSRGAASPQAEQCEGNEVVCTHLPSIPLRPERPHSSRPTDYELEND